MSDEATAEATPSAEGVAEGPGILEAPDFSKMKAAELGAVEFWSLEGAQREAYFSHVESLDSQEWQVLLPLLEANRLVGFYRQLFPDSIDSKNKKWTTSMLNFVQALGALTPKQRSVLFEALTPVDLADSAHETSKGGQSATTTAQHGSPCVPSSRQPRGPNRSAHSSIVSSVRANVKSGHSRVCTPW